MVFKTTIKRHEFGTNIVLIALYAVTGALLLLSAYGASCIAWDPVSRNTFLPFPPPGRYLWQYAIDNLLIFQISNVLCWVLAFGWGFVIYSVLTQRKWSYTLALVCSVLGFVAGIVPAVIADTNNFTEPFEMGSPHWAKTIASTIILVVLVILLVVSRVQGVSVNTYAGLESAVAGNVARQLVMMSIFLFWFAFVSFLGTEFMAGAHVVEGINVWELVRIQTIGGIATAISGGSLLASGLVVNLIKSHPSNVVRVI